MLNVLILLLVTIIAAYTGIFGFQTLKERNYLGFGAIIVLTVAIMALPVYLLFFYHHW